MPYPTKTTSESVILISGWRRADDAMKLSGYFSSVVLSPIVNDIRGSLFDPSQRDFLDVSPVWISRPQPSLFELISDVLDGQLLAFCSRRAAFELIRRENLDAQATRPA